MPLFSSCSSARIPKVHSPETVLAPLQPFLSGLNAKQLSCCSLVFFNITRPICRILEGLETFGDEEDDKEDVKKEESESESGFQQSDLITGGTLKSYQLEGVAWMATLWENGISGILGMSSVTFNW